jgi:hypothetical protein
MTILGWRAGRKGRLINLISFLVANPCWLPSTCRPSHSKKNRPSCSIKSSLSWVQEVVCATIIRGFMDNRVLPWVFSLFEKEMTSGKIGLFWRTGLELLYEIEGRFYFCANDQF